MRLQVLSDLHLEFAGSFRPESATDVDYTVIAGDVGHSPDTMRLLSGWPTPVLFVPGNHEYDGCDLSDGDIEVQELCDELGWTLLNCSTMETTLPVASGESSRVRFVGASRWWDFDLLGEDSRAACMEWGERYIRHMGSAWKGRPLHAPQVRDLASQHRSWLAAELAKPFEGKTVVITHSAPSALSADPRYGVIKGTASFCNNDDDLLSYADLWIHGHLHCPSDYMVGSTRVVCNPRGFERLKEHKGFAEQFVVEL